MRTFLPPPVQELFPPLKPDKDHLAACRDNPFFLEYLGRVQGALLEHQRRLSSDKTHEEFDYRRGVIAGMEQSLKMLETLRIEVENPPEETED